MRKISLFCAELSDSEFKLDDTFIEKFKGKQPKWGPVGYITYKRTYARDKDDGTGEEYWETCQRVVEGVYRIQQRHCSVYNQLWKTDKAQASAQEMYTRMWEFKFTPPGRGFWMMGTDYVEYKGAACLNNCAFSSTKNIADDFAGPFTFLMDMSMLGVGVGGDCRGVGTLVIQKPVRSGKTFPIPDTREGWVEATKRVLNAYVGKCKLPDFDYSLVRPLGAAIKGFGGAAAGPGPLQQLIEVDIPKVLDLNVDQKITATTIVDIYNFIGTCVVAGNVRRTAEIMFSDIDDEEFLKLKDPDLYEAELLDRRWVSNNSVFVKVGDNYKEAAKRVAKNGEPGFFWLENARKFSRMVDPADNRDYRAMGGNPCLEQTLEPYELCCLVETFPAHHDGYEDYQRTLKYAYLYAKTVTLVPTHDTRTNAVMMRNRRIGTSQSGIVQNFKKIGFREHLNWCDDGYKYLKALDLQYSEWLAVPKSNKVTSVKPSGTVSKLPGATAGIHYPPAEYYIQRIRFAKDSKLLVKLKECGYKNEPCKYSPTSQVVEIPVKEENFDKSEFDVDLAVQIANAAAMQKYWADNQVSCTVKFDNTDQDKATAQICSALEQFEDQLKGISFLPHSHGYVQAPWEPITKEQYETMSAKINPLEALTEDVRDLEDKFCDGSACEISFRDV